MLSTGFLILFGVAIANIVLGTVILLRNSKNLINLSYFFFVVAVTLWTIFNFFTDHVQSLDISLWCARFANVFGLLSIYIFWQFCAFFAAYKSTKHITKTLPILLLGSIVSITPFGIERIKGFEQAAIQELGVLYPVVIVMMFISFGGALVSLRTGLKSTKDILAKRNIQLIIAGISIAFGLAILTNILLPIITNSWNVSQLGPVFTLFLVACVAAGIVRNKLFDIRPIIARSFAYIASLAFLGLLYGFVAFVFLDKLFFDETKTFSSQRFAYIFLALISGLSFSPAKKIFDKISDRLFYRDAYNPQSFIDSLTNILVGNNDISRLLTESSKLIHKTLKPTYINFIITSNDSADFRSIGKNAPNIENDAVRHLISLVSKSTAKVIETETLGAESQHALRKKLQENAVGLVVRLHNHKDQTGIILVGLKQSGNAYTQQDINLFEIIADELSLAIQNSLRYEEIELFNKTLTTKVDSATRELRKTNEKLKALDEAKDEFISMASHQLRTPLTSVKGYISMVLEGDAGKISAQQRQLLEQAFVSSQRMVYLIADLLNVSRLKTGKFVIEPVKTQLADVVQAELSQLQEAAKVRNLEITYEKPATFPVLMLDETKTRQVVMNFIDNAIYYTPAGGHIKVELFADNKTVTYRVIDDGLGVPKAEQPHLFNKFYRAENARKARPDGTGLGLFMAKKVIVAQGGSVIFESEEGKGSTFGFAFPLSAVLPQTTDRPAAFPAV